MMENLHNHMGSGSLFRRFFGMLGDSTTTNNIPGGFSIRSFPTDFNSFNRVEGATDDSEEFFKTAITGKRLKVQPFGNGTGKQIRN